MKLRVGESVKINDPAFGDRDYVIKGIEISYPINRLKKLSTPYCRRNFVDLSKLPNFSFRGYFVRVGLDMGDSVRYFNATYLKNS